ncbi:MAG: hypothetical protein JWQ20_1160 [Conexibacter sp.]|nr:hypothetical protein [Conexibacter sp.]
MVPWIAPRASRGGRLLHRPALAVRHGERVRAAS